MSHKISGLGNIRLYDMESGDFLYEGQLDGMTYRDKNGQGWIVKVTKPKDRVLDKQTMGDRIRAMNDDELSYSIMKMACGIDPAESFCQRKKECEDLMEADKEIPAEWCRQCVLDMLRKPVDVTEHHTIDTTGKDYSGLLEE